MNIMNKRGLQDNIVTYEHYCDTKTDLSNIPKNQITLGSVAIVLQDEDGSMGIYIANSNKEWISFSNGGGGSNMSDISLSNLLDISLANPTDGQTLVYNGESGKWENKTVTNEGGGSNPEYKVIKLNKTIDAGDIGFSYIDSSFEEVLELINNGVYVLLMAIRFGNIDGVYQYSGSFYTNGEITRLIFTSQVPRITQISGGIRYEIEYLAAEKGSDGLLYNQQSFNISTMT